MKSTYLLCSLLLSVSFLSTCTDYVYVPTPENLQARQEFQDARYGMFIHWGVYATLGRGEWVMENDKISVKDYERVAATFNPTEFDAQEIVALAKAAGMNYITITSKHHDGFAMFKSEQSAWNIVDHTPYKKDVIKMLADECHKEGIKLFLYYSQLDWHNTDYYPRGHTGHLTRRPAKGEWEKYLEYMNAQLTELLSGNYGEIAGIWFDGWWDNPDADWQLEKTYKLIHDLQPQALVIANHHREEPFPGEDVQPFEKDLPGKNDGGFSDEQKISELPLETCETMAYSWGFDFSDKKYKSKKELIDYLVKAAGNNANFLLNVGPMANGKVQKEFVDKLTTIGEWLSKNGQAIYGTHNGPLAQRSWGVTTQKDNTIYVHLLEWSSNDHLYLPLSNTIVKAYYLADKSAVEYETYDKGIIIKNIPHKIRDEYDTIIALEV